uniref:ARAD1D25564p n=1 Tax=Blastobotrys adeninivorans TaxID=409370 RepID=A0A060TFT0_BLAAD
MIDILLEMKYHTITTVNLKELLERASLVTSSLFVLMVPQTFDNKYNSVPKTPWSGPNPFSRKSPAVGGMMECITLRSWRI